MDIAIVVLLVVIIGMLAFVLAAIARQSHPGQ